MSERNEPAAYICGALGVILLISGFGAYFYEEVTWGFLVTHPYRDLGVTLLVLGVALIIAAVFLYSYVPATVPTRAGKMVRFCPNCGREVASDAKFCAYCGKTLPN